LSYASNFPRKNRAARGFAHGLSGKISTRTFKNIAQMPRGIQRARFVSGSRSLSPQPPPIRQRGFQLAPQRG